MRVVVADKMQGMRRTPDDPLKPVQDGECRFHAAPADLEPRNGSLERNGGVLSSFVPRPLRAWYGLSGLARWRWLARKLRELLLRSPRLESADRTVLEQQLLTAYAADPALRSLLFVGCDWYTQRYPALFEPDRSRFRTIDIDPRKARFGAAGHVVAPLQEVVEHFAPGSIDVVVCNGVYGFGINDRAEMSLALRATRQILRDGGSLLLGWNDVAAFAPFDPHEVAVAAGFSPAQASPLGAWRVRVDTPTRHTFDFYVKR